MPLTAELPKCLLPIKGHSVLAWQLRALRAAGVERASVVVGFGADEVEQHLDEFPLAGLKTRTLLNPIFDSTDNLVSCLAARAEMDEDFLLLNGDTLLEPGVIARLLTSDPWPVSVAVVRKAAYDADDMKVSGSQALLTRIGKDLQAGEIDGEAIGVSIFRGTGPRAFVETLEEVHGQPDGNHRWYLSAVDLMAKRGLVRATWVDGLGYAEIDYPEDVARAETLVSEWGTRLQSLFAPSGAAATK